MEHIVIGIRILKIVIQSQVFIPDSKTGLKRSKFSTSLSSFLPVTATECSEPRAAILMVTPFKHSTLVGRGTTFAAPA